MNVGFHSYKIMITQELEPLKHVFSIWAQEKLENDPVWFR